MKVLINFARIIVGVLFIFSGLVKANDPLGLSYKMQEFFEVWGWNFFNDYTLTFSVLMIAFEIIAGAALLLGWGMKLVSWFLLLLIIFFTFLTGYAVLSGKIRTCGCFGDCIPLTANQSFTKDLILTALILFIFRYRNRIQPLFKPGLSIVLLLATTVFSFASQALVLKHLPVADCLPYKVGKNIPAQMKVPPGSVPDSTVITFVYNKQGKEVEFTSDKFPGDFDDSLYHFVKRYDKLIRKGNAEAPIKDFAIKSLNGGADSTDALMHDNGYSVLLFIKDMDPIDSAWISHFKYFAARCFEKNIAISVITSEPEKVSAIFSQSPDDNTPVFSCDATAVKTACRNDASVYVIKKGTIITKSAYRDFGKTYFGNEGLNAGKYQLFTRQYSNQN